MGEGGGGSVCISSWFNPQQTTTNIKVLGLDVPVEKALAGCLVAAGVVGVLALIRALTLILAIVPDSIKLAVVSKFF